MNEENKNLINDFYTIVPNVGGVDEKTGEAYKEAFTLEVIDADSAFFGWKFVINGLNFPDAEDEEKPVEEHQITVDYDVVPSVDNAIEDCYDGQEDHPDIIECLSTIILDVLQQAVKAQKFAVMEQQLKERCRNDEEDDCKIRDPADLIHFSEIEEHTSKEE